MVGYIIDSRLPCWVCRVVTLPPHVFKTSCGIVFEAFLIEGGVPHWDSVRGCGCDIVVSGGDLFACTVGAVSFEDGA